MQGIVCKSSLLCAWVTHLWYNCLGGRSDKCETFCWIILKIEWYPIVTEIMCAVCVLHSFKAVVRNENRSGAFQMP